jgi:hypothetical protein
MLIHSRSAGVRANVDAVRKSRCNVQSTRQPDEMNFTHCGVAAPEPNSSRIAPRQLADTESFSIARISRLCAGYLCPSFLTAKVYLMHESICETRYHDSRSYISRQQERWPQGHNTGTSRHPGISDSEQQLVRLQDPNPFPFLALR